MPIIAAGQRRYLLEKSLTYLFSYDLPLAKGEAEIAFMPRPGGVRLETFLRRPPPATTEQQRWVQWSTRLQARIDAETDSARKGKLEERLAAGVRGSKDRLERIASQSEDDEWMVYHVLDDITVEGNDAVTGLVRMNRNAVFLPRGEKFASIQGSLIIETDDDAVIDSRYKGCLAVGTLGLGHFDDTDQNCEDPTGAKLFLSPRFETSYPKYKWLTERQCAGFGVVKFCQGKAVSATIDIYAMKAEDPR